MALSVRRGPERPVEPEEDLPAGTKIGRFEIVRRLGHGGFGVVFEARDTELGRHVALKWMKRSGVAALRDEAREALFKREAALVARLQDAGIVTLFDFGTHDGRPYLVFELLQGETLQDRVERGPLPVREALRIAVAIARALGRAHHAGVLHRDLKPSNVFLTEHGDVKLLDFGLGHLQGGDHATLAAGTPGYASPEQWRNDATDAKTDIFSAAIMLYVTLAADLPYRVETSGSVVTFERAPGPMPSDDPRVPAPLATLLTSAMALRAAERPVSAEVWLSGLLAAERALDAAPPKRRLRWWVGALAGGILGAGAVVVGIAIGTGRSAPPTPLTPLASAAPRAEVAREQPALSAVPDTASALPPAHADAGAEAVVDAALVDAGVHAVVATSASAHPPRVRTCGPVTSRSILPNVKFVDMAAVSPVVHSVDGAIDRCFAASMYDPVVHQGLNVAVTVSADGDVTGVSTSLLKAFSDPQRVSDPPLEACVAKALRGLHFPKTATGQPGTVSLSYGASLE